MELKNYLNKDERYYTGMRCVNTSKRQTYLPG